MSEETVKLDAMATIAQAENLHHQLDDLFRTGHPVVIDASDVARVDTSVLQLLYSFVCSAVNAGVSVTWKGVSDDFRNGAKLLGLDKSLHI